LPVLLQTAAANNTYNIKYSIQLPSLTIRWIVVRVG